MASLFKFNSPFRSLFGRRRPLLGASQRSPPQHYQHLHRDSDLGQGPPPPGLARKVSRRRIRIPFVVMRYVRRPVILVIVFGFVVWLMSRAFVSNKKRSPSLKEHQNTGPSTHVVETKIILETVTKTSTVQSTQVVTHPVYPAPGTGGVNAPASNAKDAFGFPIASPHQSRLENPKIGDDHQAADAASIRSSSLHFYRADGLLEVSPTGPHPIFELIQQAETAWSEKQNKASKTLKEAYLEYQRRYGRRPPKGFEVWWTYTQSHSVPLPDEYDQIDRDLSPFWGVDPKHLGQIQRDWEGHVDSFTVGKDMMESPLAYLNHSKTNDEWMKGEFKAAATRMIETLKDVQEYLRPFRAVFSPHDTPDFPSDWELREEAKEAAKQGTYIDLHKPREPRLHGWKSSCPPFSPIWLDPIPYTPSPPHLSDILSLKHTSPHAQFPASSSSSSPPPKTFIYNHALSMDPCLHPSHLLTHGQFLSHGPGPVPHRSFTPQFSYSPSTLHDDITAAFSLNWVEDVLPREEDPPFAEKVDARLHWRGRNTGIWHGEAGDVGWGDEGRVEGEGDLVGRSGRLWWLGQRGRLVDWANKMWEDVVPRSRGRRRGAGGDQGEEVETGVPLEMRPRNEVELRMDEDDIPILSYGNATDGGGESVVRRAAAAKHAKVRSSSNRVLYSAPTGEWAVGEMSEAVPKVKWAPAMTDMAYAGEPLNCEGTVCKRLAEVYEFRKIHDGKTQGRYKYIMDVDGNGWSSRFKRLITSNALIIKSTVYREWFTDRIAPWVHYVPVQVDYSDLLDTLYFFRGDPSGNNAHEDLAARIALQGRQWSLTHWRREDLTAYNMRLFIEYARLMNPERDVKVEVEVDAEMGLGEVSDGQEGKLDVENAVVSRGSRKVKVLVGKEDYVYREEDEHVVVQDTQVSGEKKPWDWGLKQKRGDAVVKK